MVLSIILISEHIPPPPKPTKNKGGCIFPVIVGPYPTSKGQFEALLN